jgi:hypothetical protein
MRNTKCLIGQYPVMALKEAHWVNETKYFVKGGRDSYTCTFPASAGAGVSHTAHTDT